MRQCDETKVWLIGQGECESNGSRSGHDKVEVVLVSFFILEPRRALDGDALPLHIGQNGVKATASYH